MIIIGPHATPLRLHFEQPDLVFDYMHYTVALNTTPKNQTSPLCYEFMAFFRIMDTRSI